MLYRLSESSRRLSTPLKGSVVCVSMLLRILLFDHCTDLCYAGRKVGQNLDHKIANASSIRGTPYFPRSGVSQEAHHLCVLDIMGWHLETDDIVASRYGYAPGNAPGNILCTYALKACKTSGFYEWFGTGTGHRILFLLVQNLPQPCLLTR